MGRKWVNDAKGQRFCITQAEDLIAQGWAITHSTFPKLVGKRNGAAVLIEDKRREAITLHAPEPQAGSEGHPNHRMCSIEFLVNDLVSNRRPAQFTPEVDPQAMFLKQAELFRHHERRAISQWHEP